MISDEKRYEFSGQMQIAANERMTDALKIYVQTLAGIVGGSIWLTLQLQSSAPSAKVLGEQAALSFGTMAGLLVTYLYLTCVVIIIRSMRAHDKYKKIELSLCEPPAHEAQQFKPHLAPRVKFYIQVEMFILLVMSSITVAFWMFNPFWILGK
jgi:hypothetical protein